MRKSLWSPQEDEMLKLYVEQHGGRNWNNVVSNTGLHRSPKSCRLRWLNYLRPDLKRSPFSTLELRILLRLHKHIGNSWSKIASYLPGRSDNDVKNAWHTYARRRRRCLASLLQHHRTSFGSDQPPKATDENQRTCQDLQYTVNDDNQTTFEDLQYSVNDDVDHSTDDLILQYHNGDDAPKLSISDISLPHHTHQYSQGATPPKFTNQDDAFPEVHDHLLLPHMNAFPEMHDHELPLQNQQPTPEGLYLVAWKFLNPNCGNEL